MQFHGQSFKKWRDSLQGFRNIRGALCTFLEIFTQRPLAAKLYLKGEKVLRLKIVGSPIYHQAEYDGARTLHDDEGAKKTSMFFPLALFNGKDCEREIAIKPFLLRNDFDTTGQREDV